MLHLAAMCAKDSGLRLAQSLIRHHLVDPTCVDKRQATALHYAAKENNAGVVTAIFEEIDKDHRNSASVGYAQNTRPSISELLPKSSPAACSALVWAVVFDSVDACRALLERLPYQIREDNAPCYETQPEYAATETDRRNENEFVSAQDDGVACINVFLYAIMRGSLRCAALLLEHGADINCRDSEVCSAFGCLRPQCVRFHSGSRIACIGNDSITICSRGRPRGGMRRDLHWVRRRCGVTSPVILLFLCTVDLAGGRPDIDFLWPRVCFSFAVPRAYSSLCYLVVCWCYNPGGLG